ncbi:unnamed protein product [marine sediment metagenome]|uniref:Uncharacterized protein n=1 Tax=marine sediment metagenome TaxID=412755 RepID=X1I5Y1_9ZZZZ
MRWLERLLKDRAVNFANRLDKDLKLDDPNLNEYRSKILGVISIKVISYTILFTLCLDRIDFTAPNHSNYDPLTDSI